MFHRETVAIILGASAWPKSKGRWPSHDAFRNSAVDFREYLIASDGLALDPGNIAVLFDDARAHSEIDEEIDLFLTAAEERFGRPVRDVIMFYTGHGCFTEDDRKYALALRSTRIDNLGGSAYRMASIARTLNKRARNARKFIILDSCYAAAGMGDFISQSDVATRMEDDTIKAMTESGTALLCASSSTDVALVPLDGKHTMFAGALLDALTKGSTGKAQQLSIHEVAEIAESIIEHQYPSEAVRPEVQIPDQRRGNLANDRVFPNPAYQSTVEPSTLEDAGASSDSDAAEHHTEVLHHDEEVAHAISPSHLNRRRLYAFASVALLLVMIAFLQPIFASSQNLINIAVNSPEFRRHPRVRFSAASRTRQATAFRF